MMRSFRLLASDSALPTGDPFMSLVPRSPRGFDRSRLVVIVAIFAALYGATHSTSAQTTPSLPHPILFVTQVPIPADFATIGSTFGNHRPTMRAVARGGDLWIRDVDGTLRNLTAAAGFGVTGFQGDDAIAVRDPVVHWSGTRAMFSMVIGAPAQIYEYETYYWQLYEITGFAPGQTPTITLVANQPSDANNISPAYTSDDRIVFTSDRPRNGATHLYPQLDEYEGTATVTGLWRLDPQTGDVDLLNHAPSGDFTSHRRQLRSHPFHPMGSSSARPTRRHRRRRDDALLSPVQLLR